MADRDTARLLAEQYLNAGDPTGWFEALYASAGGDPSIIPWADLRPNPNLVQWLDRNPLATGLRALVVGCGLGDDAEELSRRGPKVTAFDVAPSAVDWCRRRFSGSRVSYVTADLLNPPPQWRGAFDFVLESYTLQALPPDVRPRAMDRLAEFVAPGGTLLVICRGRDANDPPGELPWPLTRAELDSLARDGTLILQSFEDYLDPDEPEVRRFRCTFRRNENRV